MECNIMQVIDLLTLCPKLVFSRVGDSKFKLYRGNFGDLMVNIKSENNTINQPIQIFNYLHDLWVIDESGLN